MTHSLSGKWKAGWALDLHTLSSTLNSDGSYTSVRSDIGEALFLLKYRNDNTQISYLVNELTKFLRTRLVLPYVDVIIPVPASVQRDIQPVHEICKQVGKELKIPVDFELIKKVKNTQQLKSIEDCSQRQDIIKGAFEVIDIQKYKNKKILIIDDLFRSGTTLNELTETLYSKANVGNVYIVTLTKTRSNR